MALYIFGERGTLNESHLTFLIQKGLQKILLKTAILSQNGHPRLHHVFLQINRSLFSRASTFLDRHCKVESKGLSHSKVPTKLPLCSNSVIALSLRCTKKITVLQKLSTSHVVLFL